MSNTKKTPTLANYADKEVTPVIAAYAAWLEEQTGYKVDPLSVYLGSALRGTFQKSEGNQKRISTRATELTAEAEAKAARKAEREKAAQVKAAAKAAAPKADPKPPAKPAPKAPAKTKPVRAAAAKPATPVATPVKATTTKAAQA